MNELAALRVARVTPPAHVPAVDMAAARASAPRVVFAKHARMHGRGVGSDAAVDFTDA